MKDLTREILRYIVLFLLNSCEIKAKESTQIQFRKMYHGPDITHPPTLVIYRWMTNINTPPKIRTIECMGGYVRIHPLGFG